MQRLVDTIVLDNILPLTCYDKICYYFPNTITESIYHISDNGLGWLHTTVVTNTHIKVVLVTTRDELETFSTLDIEWKLQEYKEPQDKSSFLSFFTLFLFTLSLLTGESFVCPLLMPDSTKCNNSVKFESWYPRRTLRVYKLLPLLKYFVTAWCLKSYALYLIPSFCL